MGHIQTVQVSVIKSGEQAVINASDFDPALHRKGAPAAKKKSASVPRKGSK
tara:strand:+ start:2057 stop:2209 length:153 start_codon:yes stop_codon:yes gene_type:complete